MPVLFYPPRRGLVQPHSARSGVRMPDDYQSASAFLAFESPSCEESIDSSHFTVAPDAYWSVSRVAEIASAAAALSTHSSTISTFIKGDAPT
jgi:hypothetical protein